MKKHALAAAAAFTLVMALGLWQVAAALSRIDFGAIPSTRGDFREGRTTATLQRAIEDALPWRDGMIATASVLRYALAKGSAEDVRVGRDGWLFLGEELRFRPDSERLMRERLALVAEANRELGQRGIRLVVALVPDKARLYSRFVPPSDVPSAHGSRYAAALQSLRGNNIAVVDLLGPLEAASRASDVYYRTDTHWNQEGAKVAANAIAQAVRASGAKLARTEFASTAGPEVDRPGDLIRLMGLEHAPAALRPKADRERPVKTAEAGSGGASLLGDFEVPATLLGTSYSLRANFHGFLQEALGARVLNAARDGSGLLQSAGEYFRDEAFRASPPQVVIWEIPERVLSEKASSPEALPFAGTPARPPR